MYLNYFTNMEPEEAYKNRIYRYGTGTLQHISLIEWFEKKKERKFLFYFLCLFFVLEIIKSTIINL